MAGKSSSVSKVIKPKRKVEIKSQNSTGNELKDSSQKKSSKLKHLEQQLAQREAELQIINSIQQGLASKLDFASIIDLVGEQVRMTTKAESIFIALYDKSSGLVS
jgi:IS30 family transposase